MTYANYAELKRTKPVRWWYDAIIDWRLANPGRPENEAAKHFGVTRSYYSIIVNSDMFKARWEQRRAAYSQEVGESIQRKLLGCLDQTLEVIEEQLTQKRTAIPFKDTTKFMTDTLAALGYGTKPGAGAVTVNVGQNAGAAVQISSEDLAQARAALLRSEELRREPLPRLVEVASPSEASQSVLAPQPVPQTSEASEALRQPLGAALLAVEPSAESPERDALDSLA